MPPKRGGRVWTVRAGLRITLLATFAGDGKVRAEPFDAIELNLALLWAR